MLTLTENAATVIARHVRNVNRGGEAGIRIRKDNSRSTGMHLEIASAPMPDDEVVERNGARVFLDHEIARYLAAKELDAIIDSSSVNLTIRDRVGAAVAGASTGT